MSTIAVELADLAVPREEILRRYPGPTGLVSRILGVVPHSSGVFEIWPPALVTVNLSVPALFDVPKCDIGLGISPQTRALVAHAASRAFGCNYCTAHTAIMGTLVQGPAAAPDVEERVRRVAAPKTLSPVDRAAIRYGLAIGQMPAPSIAPEMAALRANFDDRDVEAVVLAAVNMGLLNRLMDTLGIPLETAVEASAAGPLRDQTRWSAGHHAQGEGERPDSGEVLGLPPRGQMLREIPGAIAYTRQALANVPSRHAAQRAALMNGLGFVPYWMETLRRSEARRLFVHYMLERLTTTGVDDAVDPALKATMGWVHARAAGNLVLGRHFAFLALRAGATAAQLLAAVDGVIENPSAHAAVALTRATAGGATVLPPELVNDLLQSHSPAGIIELVTVLAIVTALHRYTHSVPAEEPEPQVQQMMERHGAELGLL